MIGVKRQAPVPGAPGTMRDTRIGAERRGQGRSWRSLADRIIKSSTMGRGFWLS
jgi:hypothetical protein